jgi:hypothetical protein
LSLGRVTLGELGPEWLPRKEGHLKSSAYRSHDNAWRVYVQPRWRAAKVAVVRYTAVQAWIAELSKKLSASRVITVYSVLAGILDDAARDRLIAANPARGVNLPRRSRRPNVYLSAEQLRQLALESGRYGSLVLLLGTVGLRWDEAAAHHTSHPALGPGAQGGHPVSVASATAAPCNRARWTSVALIAPHSMAASTAPDAVGHHR